MKKLILNITIIASALFIMNSCVKDTYDGPDTGCTIDTPENGTAISIQELLNQHTGSLIDQDLYIEGTVIADDKAGNFYKNFIIQDSTAGIAIYVNATGMNTSFPIGRNVYIILKGLYVNNYGQIVANSENDRIPVSLITKHIKKGICFQKTNSDTVAISDLNNSYLNKLVTVVGVEFSAAVNGITYADPIDQITVNLDLTDCSNNIIVRTSGYASFAGDTVPKGNGYVTGVYNVFGTDKQLLIRDINDVVLNDNRCDGSGGDSYLSKDFEDANLTSGGWTTYQETGTMYNWAVSTFGSNSYAFMSNYIGNTSSPTNDASVTWFISPIVDLSGATDPVLNFRNSFKYDGDALELMYSSNYSGDPTTATWTSLTPTLSDGDWNWVSSEDQLLPTSATVTVGFKYTGSDSEGSQWQIDEIVIREL